MTKPDYIAEAVIPLTEDAAQREWVRARSKEAHQAGCQIGRVTVSAERDGSIIYEGWKDRNADQSVPPVFGTTA